MLLKAIYPYFYLARLDKPVGTALLMLPCVFGLFFAQNHAKNPNIDEFYSILALFCLGSLIMRSAGCVINDIFDRKIDAQVARTKNRPIASGEISLKNAIIFVAILLFFGLIILLQFNIQTIFAGLFALILVILYPLMKRLTFYPQAFLGLTFNYGILMADFAINQTLSLSNIFLYIAAIFWTLIYDTIYGFQDIEDDLKIGVKSTSIAFAKNPRKKLIILAIFMLFSLIFAGFSQNSSIFYHFFAISAFLLQIILIINCNYKNPKSCLQNFKLSALVGILILFATI